MPDEDSSQRRSADLNLLAQFRCPNCAPGVKGPFYTDCIICPYSPFSGHHDSKADVQKSNWAKAQQVQIQCQPLTDPPPHSFWPEPDAPARAPVQAARPTIAVQAAPPRRRPPAPIATPTTTQSELAVTNSFQAETTQSAVVAIVSDPPRRATRGRRPLAVQFSTTASRSAAVYHAPTSTFAGHHHRPLLARTQGVSHRGRPPAGTRQSAAHGFKGVRTRKGVRGFLVEIRPPKWKRTIWLGTYNTPGEAAGAYDAGVFYTKKGPNSRYNFRASEGAFPPLPSHLRLDRPEDMEEIKNYVQRQAQEAARRVQGVNTLRRPVDEDDDEVHVDRKPDTSKPIPTLTSILIPVVDSSSTSVNVADHAASNHMSDSASESAMDANNIVNIPMDIEYMDIESWTLFSETFASETFAQENIFDTLQQGCAEVVNMQQHSCSEGQAQGSTWQDQESEDQEATSIQSCCTYPISDSRNNHVTPWDAGPAATLDRRQQNTDGSSAATARDDEDQEDLRWLVEQQLSRRR